MEAAREGQAARAGTKAPMAGEGRKPAVAEPSAGWVSWALEGEMPHASNA